MSNSLSRVKIDFNITGNEMSHEDVTDLIGIKPTQTWKKGDTGKYKALLQYDLWCFTLGYEKTNDVNDLLERVFQTFDSKTEAIKKLSDECGYDVSIDIVIEMDKSNLPALYFSKKIIKFFNELGAEIDIDLLC